MNPSEPCVVCGGDSFTQHSILWPSLVAEWQLAAHEAEVVERQQGFTCDRCGSNLRAMALCRGILQAIGASAPLSTYVAGSPRLRVLDVNGAPGVSAYLEQLPDYTRADYPAVDLHELTYTDGAFDLVLHSDTLEHLERPLRALEECRRVLAPTGRLCFTVPIIIGRLTRSRAGLAPSYHGNSAQNSADLLVHTEFGADVWGYVLQAGFANMTFCAMADRTTTAIIAWN